MKLRQRFGTRGGRLAIGLLSLGLIIALILGLLWATNALGWRRWRVNEVQSFIGAELPAGAREAQFATDQQKTRIVWLRFTVGDLAEAESFIGALSLAGRLRAGFTPFPILNPAEAALTWWTPGAAQSYTGLHAIHNSKVFELLLDEAARIVYLRVYEIGM